MPARRTDTLHIAGAGIRNGAVSHGGFPIVQISICRDIVFRIVGEVPIFDTITHHSTQCDLRIISILRSTQVFLHPALIANQNRIVYVAILVGDGWSTRTRVTISGGRFLGHAEPQREVFGCGLRLRDSLTFLPCPIDGGIAHIFHEVSRLERIVSTPAHRR